MRSKSAALQDQINELDLLIQQGGPDVQLNIWEEQRRQLNDQLQAALQEETQQQERVQAQAEAVESIVLPLDFNDLFGNPLADETIIEVVKQFRIQANEEHNAEVVRITVELNKKLQQQETAYENEIGVWKRALEESDVRRNQDIEQLNKLALERDQALLYRDNAANQLVEANEMIEKQQYAITENCELRRQIEDLKQELTAKKALTVSSNEKLAELAAKAKESTISQIDRNLKRWNEQYGLDIPVLTEPEIPLLNDVTDKEEAATDQPFPETNQVDTTTAGLADSTQTNNGESAAESEVITLESLHVRVSALEAWMLRNPAEDAIQAVA